MFSALRSHCAVVAGSPSCATRRDVDAAETAHSEMVHEAPLRRAIVVLSSCYRRAVGGRATPLDPTRQSCPLTAPPPGVRVRACVYEERERSLACRVWEEGGDVGDAIAADDAHSMASPLCAILTAPFPPHCVREMRSVAATSSRTGRAAAQIARQSSVAAQICVRAHTPWLQGSPLCGAPTPALPSQCARACVRVDCAHGRSPPRAAHRLCRSRAAQFTRHRSRACMG